MSRWPTEMRFARDGTATVVFSDGASVSADLDEPGTATTSMIYSSTYYPVVHHLRLRTVRGDEISVDLPRPDDLAPLRGRASVYLDQNHWSTLAKTIHDPGRVPNTAERAAAEKLIELATTRQIILPMSSGHMAETCKQVNLEQRYQRALTIAQLSAGWQFRDPLALRQFELCQVLSTRYHQRPLPLLPAVTLEPNAVHSGRDGEENVAATDLPAEGQWALRCVRYIAGSLDAMLDSEHVPMPAASTGWAAGFQELTTFLRDNPTGPEVKRRRTFGKFLGGLLHG